MARTIFHFDSLNRADMVADGNKVTIQHCVKKLEAIHGIFLCPNFTRKKELVKPKIANTIQKDSRRTKCTH